MTFVGSSRTKRANQLALSRTTRGRASTPSRRSSWTTTTATMLLVLVRATRFRALVGAFGVGPSSSRRISSSSSSSLSGRREKEVEPYELVVVESPAKSVTLQRVLDDLARSSSSSPARATRWIVDSCAGHVRDLVGRGGPGPVPGVDVDDGYRAIYEELPSRRETVARLRAAASVDAGCVGVALATDGDREGEAIARHLEECLSSSSDDDDDRVPRRRVVFREITPAAVAAALDGPVRGVDPRAVAAQETRRVLDRLAGFTVSPALWRLLGTPGLSAGRVQSAGLRLVVDRERARARFVSAEYRDAEATFGLSDDDDDRSWNATLVRVDGKRVAQGKDFDETGALSVDGDDEVVHLTEEKMRSLLDDLVEIDEDGNEDWNAAQWTVSSVSSRTREFSPPPPFVTSTLQQEANTRLGLSVSETMSCAQALYEAGHISYMRTDSPTLSDDAVAGLRAAVAAEFGEEAVGDGVATRRGKTKAKAAKFSQEAHEAIRPALTERGVTRPDDLAASSSSLSSAAIGLYRLVWARSLASQMTPRVVNSTSVAIVDRAGRVELRASGRVVVDPGHARARGVDDDDDAAALPPVETGAALVCPGGLRPVVRSTRPPPRYTEATFVRALEEAGVGRPSTYAGVVSTLRDRAYVGTPAAADGRAAAPSSRRRRAAGGAVAARRAAGGDEFVGSGRGPLVPSLTAFVVCSLLSEHCPSFVDPAFTAAMEARLDDVAAADDGAAARERGRSYLAEYYEGEDGLAAVVARMEETASPDDARRAVLPSLSDDGDAVLLVGPWGPYVRRRRTDDRNVTAPLPSGLAADPSTLTDEVLGNVLAAKEAGGVVVGARPGTGQEIRLKVGRFGAYLEVGSDDDPPRATRSLPRSVGGGGGRNLDLSSSSSSSSLAESLGLTPDQIVGYASLPRTVCHHEDLPVTAGLGPYGPYLKYNASYVSVPPDPDDEHRVLTIDETEAMELVREGIINGTPRGLGRGVLAELGEKEGAAVRVKTGRFGVYLSWRSVNAKLPDQHAANPADVPLEDAWAAIEEKRSSAPAETKKTKKKPRPKTSANAPKRPKSAYLHFCARHREEVANDGASLGEVTKELARRWAETDDRSEYEEAARREKEEYERTTKTTTTKTSSSSSVSKPKRPKSAYLHFCARHREEVQQDGTSLGEVTKELARRWAATDDRTEYEEAARREKEEYERTAKPTTTSRAPSKAGRATTARGESSSSPPPPKRPWTAYLHFCDRQRDKVRKEGMSMGDVTKELARLWAATNERDEYEELARNGKERYEAEIELWRQRRR